MLGHQGMLLRLQSVEEHKKIVPEFRQHAGRFQSEPRPLHRTRQLHTMVGHFFLKVFFRLPGPSHISLISDKSARVPWMENNAITTHRSLKAMNGHKRVRRSNRQLCIDSTYAQTQPNYSSLTQGNAFGKNVANSPSTSICEVETTAFDVLLQYINGRCSTWKSRCMTAKADEPISSVVPHRSQVCVFVAFSPPHFYKCAFRAASSPCIPASLHSACHVRAPSALGARPRPAGDLAAFSY